MAKRSKRRVSKKTGIGLHLPSVPDIIKVIAMQGMTDTELEYMFGLEPGLFKKWRKIYPDFDKAIEAGRTVADLQVIEALHKKAIGYDLVHTTEVEDEQGNVDTVTKIRQIEPETNAIKFWLQNRDSERWNVASHIQVTGKKGEPTVGVKTETKVELMSSILSLINPKPDGE